ncbi:iron chaperone [Kribbella sp. NBC_00359]|uniref:iron chaperone n=1 Tax=Kribbella sp. NBC_00359 TaxID=2975966 RepID=UPI002E23DC35
MAATRKTTTTSKQKSYDGFTADERDAMKERAKELKAARSKADDETAVLEKIAEMSDADRAIAERIHAIVKANAPELSPKLWYGQPAYAKAGKVVCFFQPADKFGTRYATLGFNDSAHLDDGTMWPTAYALTKLTPATEKQLTTLVKKAVS